MDRIIRRKKVKIPKFVYLIYNYINNNKKDYLIACLLFFIGLIFGIIIVNKMEEDEISKISEYIKLLVNNLQTIDKIDYIRLLKESITSNIIVIAIIWIASSTIIGIPIVYAEVTFRGFTLGYTISSVLMVLGTKNGIIYNTSTLLLHNIIFIPVLLATAVSGMKTYKSIIKNRQKDNVKLEFLRHTIFCLIMLILLVLSSIVEVYISTNFSKIIANFINI